MTNWDEAISRDRIAIDTKDMMTMAALDRVGKKLGVVLACERCHQPFQGFNEPTDQVYSVRCGCRELRAPAPTVTS